MIPIFLGYDSDVIVAFNVLQHSIIQRSSKPVAITPIKKEMLADVFTRPRTNLESTEFSFTRFLTPYLCGYQGWAIFMDNDMLVLDDIAKLWALRDDRYALMCVKHDHQPKEKTKFLGQEQAKYEKKNWSSVMLMNTAKCKALTPEYVNTASGLDLHRFKWLASDDLIGEIPASWNYLVGYESGGKVENLQNIHYTLGGPYFNETINCEFADLWLRERDDMLRVKQLGA